MGKDLTGKELGKGLRQRSDGRYEARCVINGYKIDLCGHNYQKLKAELKKKKAEYQQGPAYGFQNATAEEWFDFWFDTYKAPFMKPQSIQPMKRKVKNTFMPHIGHKQLKHLTNLDIQLAVAALLIEKKYAVSSIREALNRLSSALASAHNNNLMPTNPCHDIVVPHQEKKTCRRFLTAAEEQAVLAEVFGNWYYEMFYVMLNTGMRIGEIGGLKWGDIDFDHKCFHLHQGLTIEYHQGIKTMKLTTLKTANSYRKIPFMLEVETMLRQQQKKVQKLKARLGERYRSDGEFGDLVFVTTMGSPVTRYTAGKEVNKVVAAINARRSYEAAAGNEPLVLMEPVYPHALRHTFASKCFKAGMRPKIVQLLMGHGSYSTTIDIYTHVMGETFTEDIELYNNMGHAAAAEDTGVLAAESREMTEAIKRIS